MSIEKNIPRKIGAFLGSSRKSVLLLGPRQAGKSTLIGSLGPDLTVQLADEMELYAFSADPSELRTRIETENPKTVFIDEVQRLPGLLNTVQALIDSRRGLKFFLTGSSARKLKRGEANLLPGRVLNCHLGPFVASELAYRADTRKMLSYGALPEIYLERDGQLAGHLLRSYLSSYVREEIRAEALVRNLEAFTRFIPAAIAHVGQFVDYSKLAKRAKVSRHSLGRFYEIFEDTLIGHRLWPYEAGLDVADLVKHPRFFLFDNGVWNASIGNFSPSPDRLGVLSEQLVFTQLLHSSWASLKTARLSTFRTRGGLEVDFVLELDGDVFAIEVKGFHPVQERDASGLVQFRRYFPRSKGGFVFHMGERARKLGSVWALPWQKGLKELGL